MPAVLQLQDFKKEDRPKPGPPSCLPGHMISTGKRNLIFQERKFPLGARMGIYRHRMVQLGEEGRVGWPDHSSIKPLKSNIPHPFLTPQLLGGYSLVYNVNLFMNFRDGLKMWF